MQHGNEISLTFELNDERVAADVYNQLIEQLKRGWLEFRMSGVGPVIERKMN